MLKETSELLKQFYDLDDEVFELSQEVMEDIKEKAGLFLKDYCNFTQADIDSLENRDRTSVIALLTRRMFDEE